MTTNLRTSELRLLRLAIEIAIGSEQELIRCHTNRFTGKSFDTQVTNTSKRTIARLRKVWKKLHPAAVAESKS